MHFQNLEKYITLAKLLALVSTLWLTYPVVAAAEDRSKSPDVPEFCTSEAKLRNKYNGGLSDGQRKADNFFSSPDIASNPKKLQNKIRNALDKLYGFVGEVYDQEVKKPRRCRAQGLADGYIYRLSQLLGQCVLDGAQWAQFSANVYCSLSIELGGLADGTPFTRAPVGLCGTAFQLVCDSVYKYVASEGATPLPTITQNFCSSRGLTITPYPGCAQYTKGPFANAFSNAVQTDCAYTGQ